MKLDSGRYGLIPISEVDPAVLINFTCGTASLDEFLIKQSRAFHDARIGFTTCVFHEDVQGLAGFFTMLNTSIKLTSSESFDLGLNVDVELDNFPSVLIGKFAMREDLQHVGNGQDVMRLAIGEILDESGLSAARLVVVDAVPEAVHFYEQCGFNSSQYAERLARNHGGSRTTKMYLDVLG